MTSVMSLPFTANDQGMTSASNVDDQELLLLSEWS